MIGAEFRTDIRTTDGANVKHYEAHATGIEEKI
jgi:hypothetical protein